MQKKKKPQAFTEKDLDQERKRTPEKIIFAEAIERASEHLFQASIAFAKACKDTYRH